MTTRLHRGDLPDIARYKGAVAIDTETMGLDLARDRLCVVQLSPGDGSADVVQIPPHAKDAPNLKRLLADKSLLKIFHFARFDLGMLYKAFGGICTTSAEPSPGESWTTQSRSRARSRPIVSVSIATAPL